MASYSWFRVHHGMVSDPKWPLIARRSGHNVGTVVAVWAALLDFASQNEERGSIVGFNAEEIDALYGYDDGTTAQILQAMEDRGMVVDDVIVSWEKRQAIKSSGDSKSTAMSPAERSRRYRERQRASRNETTASRDVTACHEDETSRHVTQRDATETTRDATAVKRDVTAYKIREDKNREENIDPPLPPLGEPVADAPGESESAEADTHASPEPMPLEPEKLPEDDQGQDAKPSMPSRRKADFVDWYQAYPRKKGRDEAVRAWDAACRAKRLPPLAALLETLSWQKESFDWTKEGGRWIPNPATYLRAGSWQDEPPARKRRYYGPDANGRTPYVREDEQDFENVPRDANGGVDWAQVMGGAK